MNRPGPAKSQLVVQRDGALLVTPGEGREDIMEVVRLCAQLRHITAGSYVYELSPVALWGAAARGVTADQVVRQLDGVAATPVPASIAATIAETLSRYGAITVQSAGGVPYLHARDRSLFGRVGLSEDRVGRDGTMQVRPEEIGRIKIEAARAGWPVADCRRPPASDRRSTAWRSHLHLRPYQQAAIGGFRTAGSGLIILPCGAGKTAVGIAAATEVGPDVLVLVPSRVVAEQWRAALLDHTTIRPEDIGVAGSTTPLSPVTIATYHTATLGNASGELLGHPWSLVIYDEVQSLPADVFRLAAVAQASRRLGLTATLVREDGREREIVALVGPPVYEASWLELERDGWIAPARCFDVRLPDAASPQERTRYKLAALERLLATHDGEPTLIMGTDIHSLRAAGRRLRFPVLTGNSSTKRRAQLLEAFRSGEVGTLGLSRIGSVGIDLPDASVLIQISGTFGSRQEEAQRLGRLLRPGPGKTARFYTLVVQGTSEVRYAERRQRFLVNQGYTYEIVDAADLPRPT